MEQVVNLVTTEIDSDEESAKVALSQARQRRVDEANKAMTELLKLHRVTLDVVLILRPGKAPEAQVTTVSLD